MRKLSSNKKVLIAGAAAVVLLGGAALALTLTRSDPTAPAAEKTQGEAKGEAAETPEGVIELTAEQLQAAGISVVSVSRGGGGETLLSGRVEAMVDARAAVGAVVGGTVERVLVAPG